MRRFYFFSNWINDEPIIFGIQKLEWEVLNSFDEMIQNPQFMDPLSNSHCF